MRLGALIQEVLKRADEESWNRRTEPFKASYDASARERSPAYQAKMQREQALQMEKLKNDAALQSDRIRAESSERMAGMQYGPGGAVDRTNVVTSRGQDMDLVSRVAASYGKGSGGGSGSLSNEDVLKMRLKMYEDAQKSWQDRFANAPNGQLANPLYKEGGSQPQFFSPAEIPRLAQEDANRSFDTFYEANKPLFAQQQPAAMPGMVRQTLQGIQSQTAPTQAAQASMSVPTAPMQQQAMTQPQGYDQIVQSVVDENGNPVDAKAVFGGRGVTAADFQAGNVGNIYRKFTGRPAGMELPQIQPTSILSQQNMMGGINIPPAAQAAQTAPQANAQTQQGGYYRPRPSYLGPATTNKMRAGYSHPAAPPAAAGMQPLNVPASAPVSLPQQPTTMNFRNPAYLQTHSGGAVGALMDWARRKRAPYESPYQPQPAQAANAAAPPPLRRGQDMDYRDSEVGRTISKPTVNKLPAWLSAAEASRPQMDMMQAYRLLHRGGR